MGARTLRRLLILVTLVIVAAVAVFLLQRHQIARMDRAVLARAEQAEKSGDFEKAAHLYQEHLEVVRDDQAAQLKYADALVKGRKNPAQIDQAAQVLEAVVNRSPGRGDIRRRLAELQFERGRYSEARANLEILAQSASQLKGGDLQFLLGRCQEETGDADLAVASYQAAAENGAAQALEAAQRRATLLRGQLQKAEEADRVIDEMVRAHPQDYRVYLERGRYRRRFGKTLEEQKAAREDLERALAQGAKDFRVYIELAETYQVISAFSEARRVLEAGLKAMPNEPLLHQAVALMELRAGSADEAVKRLRGSLEVLPDEANLHWLLANILAERGETSQLLLQTEELRRLNFGGVPIDFLDAYYRVNSGDWTRARQALVNLQPRVESSADFKARVNNLLARCYANLGDREHQRDAYARALRANPQYTPARLGLAASLAERGEIEEAISEYREILKQDPQARFALGQLLIARNQQRSAAQRDWKEVEGLIRAMEQASPASSEPLILRAKMLAVEGKFGDAQKLLEQARARLPQDVDLWVESIDLLRRQRKYSEVQALVAQAPQAVRAATKFQLAQARFLIERGGPDLPRALDELARASASLSKADRRLLLMAQAQELARLNQPALAAKVWSDMTALDPGDLEPQIQLLDLAFQSKNTAEIERRLGEIRRIDRAEGVMSRFQESRYTIWKAQQATLAAQGEKSEEARNRRLGEASQLRGEARSRLNELLAGRPDWSLLYLALASLDEQVLAQPGLDPESLKAKQLETANRYIRAIELGQKDLNLVRRATDLLYAAGQRDRVSQLWNLLPRAVLISGNLQRQVSLDALRSGDTSRALELAREAVEANPKELRARLWLVQVLMADGRRDEAETALRAAVDVARSEPDRWLALVQFLTQTQQMSKAEKALQDAEAALKESSPVGLAECSTVMARTYKAVGSADEKARAWYDAAARWYRSARAARPDDLAVTRQYVEFLLDAGRAQETEAELTAILEGRGGGPKNAEETAWARRSLALALLARRDYEQTLKALTLVQPIAEAAGTARKAADLRVLARVYDAQNTQAYHKKAREVVEELVASDTATAEDRFLFARMCNADGEWDKAHEQYQMLLAQTETSRDLGILIRRPDYIQQFAADLLKRCQSDPSPQLLSECQDLIEKLKTLRPNTLGVVELEALFLKIQNQTDDAVELVRKNANLPNLSDGARQGLARLAEEMGQMDLAEEILRQLVKDTNRDPNRVLLAGLLGRRGRPKEAIDLCEQLWKASANPETLVQPVLDVLFTVPGKSDLSQVDRVAEWMRKSLQQRPNSSIITIALANLRERQGKFDEAEALYQRDVDQGTGDPVSLNNLAWLMTLRNGDGRKALDLINRAVARRGPISELLDTRGVVYVKAGDSRRAIEDLERATTLDPAGPKYFHLAQAYLGAGNKDAARQAMAKARARGLTAEGLHTLEVPAYQQVLKDVEDR